MENVIAKAAACTDVDTLQNVVRIMSEYIRPDNSGRMLEMMKAIIGEVGECHYDEETSTMHLCLISQLYTIDDADRMWRECNGVTRYDWRVLWGEMCRMHSDKIRRWFPGIGADMARKRIYDECMAFLKAGLTPWHDLNV